MAPLGGRPVLQHVLDRLDEVRAELAGVVVVLGDDAEGIEADIAWRAERRVREPVAVFEQFAGIVEEDPVVLVSREGGDGEPGIDHEHAHFRDVFAVGDLRRVEADLVLAAGGQYQQAGQEQEWGQEASHARISARDITK